MKNLQLIPGFHNSKSIDNTFFVFDKVFYGFPQMQIVHTFSSVSKKSLANIKSPLDYIVEKQKAENEHITKIKTYKGNKRCPRVYRKVADIRKLPVI